MNITLLTLAFLIWVIASGIYIVHLEDKINKVEQEIDDYKDALKEE